MTGADDAVLDGFTIRDAFVEDIFVDGGGMLNVGVSPTIMNCTFTENKAEFGGGMTNVGASPLIIDCTFSFNDAEFYGGAMYNKQDSWPYIAGGTFNGNFGDYGGGAIHTVGSTVRIKDSKFVQNSGVLGGALNNVDAFVFVEGCAFEENSVGNGSGGAISNSNTSGLIANSLFIDNVASGAGAIENEFVSSLQIDNCVFAADSFGNGGAIGAEASSLLVNNCTFVQSLGEGGPGVFAFTVLENYVSSPVIQNSIFSGFPGNAVVSLNATPSVSYSNLGTACASLAGVTCGPGNIAAATQFVDAAGGDYRLQLSSPGVDGGSTALLPPDSFNLDGDADLNEPIPVDFDGNPRVVGGSVDMGAFEHSLQDCTLGSSAGCPAESCQAIKTAAPAAPSGDYWIKPDASPPFIVRCDMSGVWTLLFQQGQSFVVADAGDRFRSCYGEVCSSAAYSSVPLGTDLRIDASDVPMLGEDYFVRSTITGLEAALQGSTLATLLTSGTKYYLEADDNSNLTNEFTTEISCAQLWPFEDWHSLACGQNVITLNDPQYALCPGGAPHVFPFGGEESRTQVWNNCAGWHQNPSMDPSHFYPHYLRVWTR